MKRLLTTCLLFLSLSLGAQNIEEADIDFTTGTVNLDTSEEEGRWILCSSRCFQ